MPTTWPALPFLSWHSKLNGQIASGPFRCTSTPLFAQGAGQIDAQRLTQVREARRPNSRYAKIEQCRWELGQADKLFRREGIAVQNTTHTSIEEIASKILAALGIERHMF